MDTLFVAEAVAAALFLAVVNKTIVDALANPVRQRYPDLDMWWLFYVALFTGFAIGWFSDINVFPEEIMSNILVGKILTSLLIGGGSSLIHDIFDSQEA
jgi:hypothetical protein